MRPRCLNFDNLLPRVCANLISTALSSAMVVAAGCGGNANSTGGRGTSGSTTVTILSTCTSNDHLSRFMIVLNDLTLTSQSGRTASLIPAPINAEFLHVNGTSEPLVTSSVPQDVYTAAAASIGYSAFECVAFDASKDFTTTATFAYGSTPATSVTVSLTSPLTIAGNNMELMLDLQVPQSATYNKDNCATTASSAFSITPTFTLAPAGNAGQVQAGLKGIVASLGGAQGSFTVTAADGPNCVGTFAETNCSPPTAVAPAWHVTTANDTVFEGISNPSQLTPGIAVDMDATVQPDGSLQAKRIAVYDDNPDPTNLSVAAGPVLYVYGPSPILDNFMTEDLGPLQLDADYFSFGDARFQISNQLNNVQALPFPAGFSAANMVAGQNVYVSTHDPSVEASPIYSPASTITLVPQTIDGTVTATGSQRGFPTFTVALASYDIFPAFAVQPSQTTVLANPGTVIVYADGNTKMLSTSPIAVGSVARFYGLVFNDNGTLRMDCAQISDGVPE